MKVNEVPQDKGYLVKGKISDLNYAVDENGNYTSMQSQGWQPKNEAMSMAWDIVYERTEDVRQKVLDGKLSPVAFYMELNLMDTTILSGYTGLARWKVKRHLKMKNFSKLKHEVLNKYAGAFKISTQQLTDINIIREIELKHEN